MHIGITSLIIQSSISAWLVNAGRILDG